MADTPEDRPGRDATPDVAEQLRGTAVDVQELGVSLGALPAGSMPPVATRRRLIATVAGIVVVAALLGLLLWRLWHSIFVLVAPLAWIFWHSWRWRHRRQLMFGEAVPPQASHSVAESATPFDLRPPMKAPDDQSL